MNCNYFVQKPQASPMTSPTVIAGRCTRCGKPSEAHEHCGKCAKCKAFALRYASYCEAIHNAGDDKAKFDDLVAAWQSLQPELRCEVNRAVIV